MESVRVGGKEGKIQQQATANKVKQWATTTHWCWLQKQQQAKQHQKRKVSWGAMPFLQLWTRKTSTVRNCIFSKGYAWINFLGSKLLVSVVGKCVVLAASGLPVDSRGRFLLHPTDWTNKNFLCWFSMKYNSSFIWNIWDSQQLKSHSSKIITIIKNHTQEMFPVFLLSQISTVKLLF